VKQFGQQFDPDSLEGRKAARALPIPVVPDLKKCEGPCGTLCDIDRAPEYFDVDSQAKDGFKRICKACRAEQRALKEAAASIRQLEHIDKALLARLANARPGGPNVPHSADLLERIYTLIGGANGMAALLMKTFIQSPPGSPTQQKILAQIMSLTHQNTEVGGAKKPVETLSDEEIDAELDRLLRMKSVPASPQQSIRILPEDFDDESDMEREATAE
jgi:hypothetical protein